MATQPFPNMQAAVGLLQVTKLVGKIDQGLDKVRSLTQVFGKKARHEGPCTLKLKVEHLICNLLSCR